MTWFYTEVVKECCTTTMTCIFLQRFKSEKSWHEFEPQERSPARMQQREDSIWRKSKKTWAGQRTQGSAHFKIKGWNRELQFWFVLIKTLLQKNGITKWKNILTLLSDDDRKI
jgi:hypothetical protein